jgi:hypothetical protein
MAESRVPLEQPWASRWLRRIDACYPSTSSRVALRRKDLVLALSGRPGGEALRGELATLGPQLAASYAMKSAKALDEDVHDLAMWPLIYFPRPELVRVCAFKRYEPRRQGELSPAQATILRSILGSRAPHLLPLADKLEDGGGTTSGETRSLIDAVWPVVSRETSKARISGLGAHVMEIVDLLDNTGWAAPEERIYAQKT